MPSTTYAFRTSCSNLHVLTILAERSHRLHRRPRRRSSLGAQNIAPRSLLRLGPRPTPGCILQRRIPPRSGPQHQSAIHRALYFHRARRESQAGFNHRLHRLDPQPHQRPVPARA
jgi:hypothetical protein